jgi:hypothetical protein
MFRKIYGNLGVLLILSTVAAYGQAFTGRVGASHDGNQHDHDDIGAAAWDIGIFAKAGARIVHDDYADHLADNDTSMEHAVEASVLGSVQRWYGSTSMCYNDQHNLQGAINNIAAQINASSASDRFYYILCGPMEVPFRGIMASDSAKRKYCTCISHSGWNDSHTSSQMTHTWSDIQKTGVTAVHIADQNTLLNDKTSGAWDWAKNSSDEKLHFMWDRMANYGVYGDISDAGMAWYVVTGLVDQAGTMAKLRAFFQKSTAIQSHNSELTSPRQNPRVIEIFTVDGSKVMRGGNDCWGKTGLPVTANRIYIVRTREDHGVTIQTILPIRK